MYSMYIHSSLCVYTNAHARHQQTNAPELRTQHACKHYETSEYMQGEASTTDNEICGAGGAALRCVGTMRVWSVSPQVSRATNARMWHACARPMNDVAARDGVGSAWRLCGRRCPRVFAMRALMAMLINARYIITSQQRHARCVFVLVKCVEESLFAQEFIGVSVWLLLVSRVFGGFDGDGLDLPTFGLDSYELDLSAPHATRSMPTEPYAHFRPPWLSLAFFPTQPPHLLLLLANKTARKSCALPYLVFRPV